MDPSVLFGLPAHPLLVHVPVVLLPLVAIGTVAIVVSASLRERFGWLVVALAGFALLGVQLAMGSGEALDGHVEKSQLLERHTELANSLRPLAIVLFLLVLAVVLLGRRRLPGSWKWAAPVVGVLAVLSAVGTTARLAEVGHAGAKATWHETNMRSRSHESGDHDEAYDHR